MDSKESLHHSLLARAFIAFIELSEQFVQLLYKLFRQFSINAFASFHLLFQDNDSDEEEDFHIKPDDNLIVTGHVDEDFSALEISGVAQVGYI